MSSHENVLGPERGHDPSVGFEFHWVAIDWFKTIPGLSYLMMWMSHINQESI